MASYNCKYCKDSGYEFYRDGIYDFARPCTHCRAYDNRMRELQAQGKAEADRKNTCYKNNKQREE